MPTLRVTPHTTAVRGRLAQLSQEWQTLTDAQKAAWVTWAQDHPIIDRLGDPQVLQGSDAYIQLNMRLDALGEAHIAVPPISAPPGAIEELTVTSSAAADSCSLAWTSGALGATEALAVWVAVVTSPGRNYYKNLLKLVEYSAGAQASPLDVGASVVDRFGDILEGQKLFVHAFIYSKTTGMSGALAQAQCIVAA
jgi:hypothetical protein